MPSTYSVYNIKIDNEISFTPGAATGSVLAINTQGIGYWTTPTQGPTGAAGVAGATGSTGPAPTDTKTFQTLTDAATVSWVYTSGYNAKVTIAGNRWLSITGAASGDYGTLIVTQASTGSYVLNFTASHNFISNTYSFTTTGTASDIYSFVYDGVNYWWNFAKNYS